MHPSRLAAQSTDHANEVPTSEYMEHSRCSLTSANMDVYHNEPASACAPRGPLKGAANALDHTLEVPSQTSFCCTMLCKRCLCHHAVTFVNSVNTSKVIIIFFTVRQPNHSSFFHIKRHGNIPTGTSPSNGGVECRWGRLTSRFSTNIWLCDR